MREKPISYQPFGYVCRLTNISFFVEGGGFVDKLKNIPNRLINEKSPYLLQHAYNPVRWYAWGEDAFEKARLEGKPVFLSIGYS